MAGAKAPAFSLGLGLRLRAQERQLKAAASDFPVAALSLFAAFCEIVSA
jgi:hypothetical protein